MTTHEIDNEQMTPETGSERTGARRGQIVIMYALMLPVLLGMAALAMDVAYLYSQKRSLQLSADLAAVAGAGDLPANATTAKTVAAAYATKNGWTNGVDGVTVTTVTPFGGDASKIEVEITYPAPTFFARVMGFNSVNVKARAVAFRTAGSGYAVFAKQQGCSTSSPVPANEVLDWSGSIGLVKGKVHSNSGYKQSGSNNTVTGSGSYVCTKNISGSGNTYSTTGDPAQTAVQSLPITFTAADFPCTYTISGGDINSSGSWWVNTSTKKELKPGNYCATGLLKLSGSDIKGTVTFVALGTSGMVETSGSNFDLKPFTKNVLAYSEGVGKDYGMKLSGSNGAWAGYLWAGNGSIEMSGSSNFTLGGSIISNTVKLNGSGWSIDNSGTGSSRARLVE